MVQVPVTLRFGNPLDIGARATLYSTVSSKEADDDASIAAALKYLAHDELTGRSLWGEPLARMVHYAADVRGRSYYLSIGITADRKVASFEFQGR